MYMHTVIKQPHAVLGGASMAGYVYVNFLFLKSTIDHLTDVIFHCSGFSLGVF